MNVAVQAGPATGTFPGVPAAAPAARRFARRVLGDGHPAADVTELCLTELVANAIAHTRSGWPGGAITVTVGVAVGAVVVTVVDQGSLSVPVLAGQDALAETGRGLRLVDALADDWGTAPDPAGRVVWFCCEDRRPVC